MPKAELLKRLDELHAELQALKDVDAESLEALQRIAREIREVVQLQTEPTSPALMAAAVRERLEELESDHPIATRFLSQMTDLLGLMGI